MNSHTSSLKALSGIVLGPFLSLGLYSQDGLADDVSDLTSRNEASSIRVENEASRMIDNIRSNAIQDLSTSVKVVDSSRNDSQYKGASVDVPSRGVQPNQTIELFSFKSQPLVSAQQYPKQEVLKDIHIPHEGKQNCKSNNSQNSGKCPSSLLQGLESTQSLKPSSGTQLLIFVSQSVPADSLKELWNDAQKVGGKLLFRGLVGGNFKETQKYIHDLGIVADIDPTKFEEFEVTQVPAFILSKGDKYDKMVGNVSLTAFLEQASASGECKEESARLYNKVRGGSL